MYSSLTLLYQRLCMLHKPRGVCSCRFEVFGHREHIDDILLTKHWPVSRLEHVLPQLYLNTEKKEEGAEGELLHFEAALDN